MKILSGCHPLELNQGKIEVFDRTLIDMLDIYSRRLLEGIGKNVVAIEYLYFAMWIRKKNLDRYKDAYANKHVRGRGMTIHIAPTNVPTNALFTLVFGLLSGNSVAMRVSEKSRADLHEPLKILDALKANLRNLYSVFECTYQDVCFTNLSEQAKALVIWGGDQTISNVISGFNNKKIKTLTFANRTSFSVMSVKWLEKYDESHKKKIAKLFARDLYSFGQRACSSPRLLILVGNLTSVNKGRLRRFIEYISDEGKIMGDRGVKARDCYINAEEFSMITGKSNLIDSKNIYCPLYNEKEKGLNINDLYEMGENACLPIIVCETYKNLSKYARHDAQTLTMVGVNGEERDMIYQTTKNTSITRYANPGTALNMDIVWDGYDILDELTRKIQYG